MRIRIVKTSLHLHRRNPDPRARQRRPLTSRRPTLELLEQRDLLAVSLTQISSPSSPFATCTVGGLPGSISYINAEVEPRVAVNPTNPKNIIAVFQQDRWSDGGAHGLVAAVTHDGGATWHESWAPLSTCAGGTATNGGNYDRASDPWVTFAPNGDAYQISLSFSANMITSAVLVSKSTDGGDTWSDPKTLIRDDSPFHFNDKESITADPTDPTGQTVYAVWDRSRFPSDNANFNALHSSAFRGDIMFSRSTDGGQTWTPASDLFAQNKNQFTIGNQITVLPDGTLVDAFNLLVGSGRQPSGVQTFEAVIRSTDKGETWSKPIIIAQDQSLPVFDPLTGELVRSGEGLPDIAVDPNNGGLYVVWADGRFSHGTHDDIALSRSTDGGLTWSPPIKANQTPIDVAAFTPSVKVAADGTVGVTYYDFRNINSSDPTTLPTDYFLARSHNGGMSWDEVRITPTPFDMRTAPVSTGRGFFIGDYQGLTSIDNQFLPVFVQTNSGNTENPTDVFEARISTTG